MKTLLLISTLLFNISVFSQGYPPFEGFLYDVASVSSDLLEDGEMFLEGYFSPIGEMMGAGLNAGWFNSAKPHKLGGFDITGGFHFIGIPDQAKSFNLSDSFNQFEIINEDGNNNIPTFVGANNTNAEIQVGGQKIFDAPAGKNIPFFGIPYFQGSIGGPKKTEVLFRLSPFKLDFEQFEISYWGIGLKHDLFQWIPVVDKLPLDLSYLIAYSNLSSNFDLSSFSGIGDNSLDFTVRGLTQYLCLSKKLSFITVYLGGGHHFSNSRLKLNGFYNSENGLRENPFDFSFGGVEGFKLDGGVRMKFLVFNLHAQYSMAEYNMFTLGIGITTDGLY